MIQFCHGCGLSHPRSLKGMFSTALVQCGAILWMLLAEHLESQMFSSVNMDHVFFIPQFSFTYNPGKN